MSRTTASNKKSEIVNRKPAAQDFSGQNVVREINADDSARVSVRQIVYPPLSEIAEECERQKSELVSLQEAIVQKFSDLHRLINSTIPISGNPYLFLQPFGFSDRTRFFGREDILSELMGQMRGSLGTFLCGTRGIGKTSLIRAGLVPALLLQGHLPLVVSTTREALESSIKKYLLPNVDNLQFLKTMSLTGFIHIIASALPDGKKLYVLVDDFEVFFEHGELERDAFHNEWLRCFNGASANVRWLFCVPSNLHHLLNFFKHEISPNSNTVNVPPLSREAARAAIIKPAERYGISIQLDVLESILDTLGGSHINPADLQLVCYMLAGGRGAPVKEWDMKYYTEQGKTDGILRDYLDRAMTDFEPHARELAWETLTVLADPATQAFTDEQIIKKMRLFGAKESTTRRILIDLQNSNLIEHTSGYQLSSDGLRPRIEKWREARSILTRARQEAAEQLQNIRNSALRGLAGGALGFVLMDRLLFTAPLSDVSFEIFSILLTTSFGAFAGLLMTFLVDISIASYGGSKKTLAYLAGGISGAFSFALAMVMYANLNNTGSELFLSLIPKAILEGSLWGLTAGAGTVWALSSRRPLWITVPLVVFLCGLVLSVADIFIGVLGESKGLDTIPLTIALSGMVFPGFILAATLIGRYKIR